MVLTLWFANQSRTNTRYCKIKSVLLFALTLILSSSPSAREVEDLALGVALFEFFQQQDFEALSEILIAEKTSRLNKQRDFSSQFAAGIMLSYGMDEAASERLQTNKTAGLEGGENGARTSYYLAKLLYRKGEHQKAYKLLQSVDSSLTDALVPELAFLLHSSFLKSNLLNANGNLQNIGSEADYENYGGIAGLEPQLESGFKLPRNKRLKIWGNYLNYNESLNVLPQDNQFAKNKTANNQSQSLFQIESQNSVDIDALEDLASRISQSLENVSLDKNPQRFNELLALRDRALLSVAYLYLMQEQPQPAIKKLRAYSANGVEVDEALLAYGWAQLQSNNLDDAMASWQQLAQGDIGDATTRESILGIAHLYELQDNDASAISAYDQAISKFEQEIEKLDQFKLNTRSENFGQFFDALQNNTISWLEDYKASEIELLDVGHTELLYRLRSIVPSDEFIVLINQRRDIEWLARHNLRWQENLSAMRDSQDNQRKRFAEVFNEDYQNSLVLHRNNLKARLNVAKKEMNKVSLGGDNLNRLMTADELARRAKAKKVEEKLAGLASRAQQLQSSSAANEKLNELASSLVSKLNTARLASGSVLWNAEQQSDRRAWAMKKQLKIIGRSLEDSSSVLQDVQALVPEQQTQATGLNRIGLVEQRREAIERELSRLGSSLDRELIAVIDREISIQREELYSYLAQAQLGKARLLDGQFMQRDALVQIDSSNVEEVAR